MEIPAHTEKRLQEITLALEIAGIPVDQDTIVGLMLIAGMATVHIRVKPISTPEDEARLQSALKALGGLLIVGASTHPHVSTEVATRMLEKVLHDVEDPWGEEG